MNTSDNFEDAPIGKIDASGYIRTDYGWLKCEGQKLNGKVYPKLIAELENAHSHCAISEGYVELPNMSPINNRVESGKIIEAVGSDDILTISGVQEFIRSNRFDEILGAKCISSHLGESGRIVAGPDPVIIRGNDGKDKVVNANLDLSDRWYVT